MNPSIRLYIELARPHHYVKNIIILLPLFFGHKLLEVDAVIGAFTAFAVFCLACSAVYVLNDLMDVPEDRNHPKNRYRPLARGAIEPSKAVTFMLLLLICSFALAFAQLAISFLIPLSGYCLLNLMYSALLKKYAIIDLMCIATGFVIRIYAGGEAALVPISNWIVVLTFVLALFLALAKRRGDLVLGGSAINSRKALGGYNLEFVTSSMFVFAAIVIVCYALYTTSPEVIEKHRTGKLYFSSFWVFIGILRYLQLMIVQNKVDPPISILLDDFFLQMVIALWALTLFALLYGSNLFT